MAILGQLGTMLPIKEDDILIGKLRGIRKCRSKAGDVYYSLIVEIRINDVDRRYRMSGDEELSIGSEVECIWNDTRTFLAVYKKMQ